MEDNNLDSESIAQIDLAAIFSRDLVECVMGLLHPAWSHEQYSDESPFTENVKFQVLRILDKLRKEIVCFYGNAFQKGTFRVESFNLFCQKQIYNFSERLFTIERFIHFCATMSTLASLAYSDGIKDSPLTVMSLIEEFLKTKFNQQSSFAAMHEKLFWGLLEQKCKNFETWNVIVSFKRYEFDIYENRE